MNNEVTGSTLTAEEVREAYERSIANQNYFDY